MYWKSSLVQFVLVKKEHLWATISVGDIGCLKIVLNEKMFWTKSFPKYVVS